MTGTWGRFRHSAAPALFLVVVAGASAGAVPGLAASVLPLPAGPPPAPVQNVAPASSSGATSSPAARTAATGAAVGAPAACAAVHPTTSAWTTVFSTADPYLDNPMPQPTLTVHGAEISVDPWQPCRIYRSTRDRVDRSEDGGAHWSTVFQDPSPLHPAAQTAGYDSAVFGPILPVAPGRAYLVDRGGDDGVYYTADQGVSWSSRATGIVTAPYLATEPISPSFLNFSGTGIAPVEGDTGIRALEFAPSDPSTGYLITSLGGQTVLYRTTNGGQLWTPTAVPETELDTVAIDPVDPQHVMAAGGGGWTATRPEPEVPAGSVPVTTKGIWESTDGGASWRLLPGPRSQSPFLMVLTRFYGAAGSPGSLHVYAAVLDLPDVGGIVRVERFQSSDDGTTWDPLPLPTPSYVSTQEPPVMPLLLVDPLHPQTMLWASPDSVNEVQKFNRIVVDLTTDGFVTASRSVLIGAPSPDDTMFTLDGSVDHSHDFFLGDSYGGAFPQRDVLHALHVDPAATLPGIHDLGSVPARRTCALDPIAVADMNAKARSDMETQNSGSTQSSDPYWNGSMAYDGQYLDYTQDDLAPGIIYRLDPTTCTSVAPIRLGPPGPTYNGEWTVPALEALTYDPLYRFANGDVGAILARGHSNTDSGVAYGTAPVYAVDPQTGGYQRAFAVPCSLHRDFSLCDNPTGFSYDLHRGGAWVAIPGQQYLETGLGLEATAGAARPAILPTCMTATDWSSPYAEPFGPEAAEAATWVAGGADVLYAENEDHQSIYSVNSATCTVVSGFRHAAVNDADEHIQQMACDPVTIAGASVLWLRNSLADTVTAYPIPDGHCPFPTTLRLVAQPAVAAGSLATVCAVLAAASSPPVYLGSQAITFTIAGTAYRATTAAPKGRGCVQVPAGVAAGSRNVRAEFGGNTVYLPASDSGLLEVEGAATLPPPGPPPAPSPAPHQPGGVVHAPVSVVPQVDFPPPAPQPQPPPSTTQTQGNPQAAQQPGLMEQQQQQREQAAIQDIGRDDVRRPVYEATASRRGDVLPFAPVLTAAVVLLGALALRRPSVSSLSKHRRGAHPQRRATVSRMAARRRRGML